MWIGQGQCRHIGNLVEGNFPTYLDYSGEVFSRNHSIFSGRNQVASRLPPLKEAYAKVNLFQHNEGPHNGKSMSECGLSVKVEVADRKLGNIFRQN